jgi:hypothetical protein
MSRLVYFGDIDKGYLTKLNRIYDSIEIITNEQAKNFNWNYPERYTTGEDIFISRNYPQCLYYELEGGEHNDLATYKIIGIRDACYDDEADDYNSNLPVNDLKEKMTHYLTDTGLCTVKIGFSEQELKELEPEFKSSYNLETSAGGDCLTYTFENIPYYRIIQFYNDIKPIIRPFKQYTKDHNKNIVHYSFTVEIRNIREHIREFHNADKITDINITFTLLKIKHFNPHNNVNKPYIRLSKEICNISTPFNKRRVSSWKTLINNCEALIKVIGYYTGSIKGTLTFQTKHETPYISTLDKWISSGCLDVEDVSDSDSEYTNEEIYGFCF